MTGFIPGIGNIDDTIASLNLTYYISGQASVSVSDEISFTTILEGSHFASAENYPGGDGGLSELMYSSAASSWAYITTENLPDGDFNGDGNVDQTDLIIWNQNQGIERGATLFQGDADRDGDVDVDDLEIWAANTDIILVSNDTDIGNYNYAFGDVSLREAVAIAGNHAGPDTIMFAPWVDEIVLTNGQLTTSNGQQLDIIGPGADQLTIRGRISSPARVIEVSAGSTSTISGLTMTGGRVTGALDQGGVVSNSGTLTLDSVVISDSTSAFNGGGIYNTGTLTLDNVVLVDNVASNYGGAIYNNSGNLTIVDTTIESNDAARGGGIYYNRASQGAGSLDVQRSAFIGNTSGYGGALYVYSFASVPATVHIENATFSGNSASYGGAIYTNGSPVVTVVNSTIAYNTASLQGGGIHNVNAGANITLHNTILADNTAAITSTRNINSGATLNSSSSHNLLGLGHSGGLTHGMNGNIVLTSGTAGLTALGNYGGPTKSHALLSTSLAIDAGDNAITTAYSLNTDQRGEEFDRIVDWNGDLNARVDIGALELALSELYT